jgi:hypothetical protein
MENIGRNGLTIEPGPIPHCYPGSGFSSIIRAMKKILIIVCVILLAASTGAFAAARGNGFAIGGEGSLDFAGIGLPGGAMLTLHFPRVPVMFGIGLSAPLAIAFTADYWVAQGPLASIFTWYAGVGGYFTVDPNAGSSSLGARVPLGLQMWPFGRTLEVFIELAPAVGVNLVPTSFAFHFQGALGFRIWV